MSSKAIDSVRRCAEIVGPVKNLLKTIAFYADNDLSPVDVWVDQLADDMGISRSRVQQITRQAVAEGFLRVEVNGGVQQKNRYSLIIPQGVEPAPRGVEPITPVLSVCLSVNDSNLIEYRDNRQTDNTGGANYTGGGADYTPSEDEREIINWLADAQVVGSHVTRWVKAILLRPNGRDEVGDVLDYFEAQKNLAGTEKGQRWLAKQIRLLSEASPGAPPKWDWQPLKPKQIDPFEEIKNKYGGYMRFREDSPAYAA